jgi:hypothetical protein
VLTFFTSSRDNFISLIDNPAEKRQRQALSKHLTFVAKPVT